VWAGLTGIRGGQRITTGEFEDFSYRRSHPFLLWEQRTLMKKWQSTSNGGDGQRDSDGTAMAMDGTVAMRHRCNSNAMATATQRREQQWQ
jgi:hypothetical protein